MYKRTLLQCNDFNKKKAFMGPAEIFYGIGCCVAHFRVLFRMEQLPMHKKMFIKF